MSITVRLIFWGLIGFVPNPEGHKGLTALLIDTSKAQLGVEPACAVPPHLSAVYLLDGQCDGDCKRIPLGRKEDATSMGFSQLLNGKAIPLTWLLDHEDLDISGDEGNNMKFESPWLNFIHKIAPSSKHQASYFSWVESMDKLTGEKGGIRADCVAGQASCPLLARFKIQGGKAGACHLFHLPESPQSKDTRRSVQVFDLVIPGQKDFQQAIADAVSVDFEADGDSVVLFSQGLPGHPGATTWARLKPDEHGNLTLVVANFPPHSAGHGEDSHSSAAGCAPPHSDILFGLLANKPNALAVRKKGKQTPRVNPGSCELEAIELAKILSDSGSNEPPHSPTACDGRTFH